MSDSVGRGSFCFFLFRSIFFLHSSGVSHSARSFESKINYRFIQIVNCLYKVANECQKRREGGKEESELEEATHPERPRVSLHLLKDRTSQKKSGTDTLQRLCLIRF